MIKTRLIKLLSESKKYIGYQVFWQWTALLSQIVIVFQIAEILENAKENSWENNGIVGTVCLIGIMLCVRFASDKLASKAGYAASADVKRILREKINEKLLRLGTSYRERITTSEVVQLSTEGVEQLETYFGKYLPQFFYSLLAPLTLFGILSLISVRASVVLLIVVPLIPFSIVAVQKFARKLLSKYWGIYAGLGDFFLENVQGLTTLKIYQADEERAKEMDAESEHFRRITMKVLTMQLNSTSVMDIMAYGGAAAGMITACMEYLSGNIDFSGAIIIVLLAAEFFLPLRLLGSYFHIAMNGMAASDKIFALLDSEEPKTGNERFPDKKIDITLEKVGFFYEDNRMVLNRIDMEIPMHSFTALVGESGCGKSTIINLLTGKNKGYTGKIKIGDTEVSNISETELMRNITLVRHNSYLFGGTVRENLRMADGTVTEQKMIQVLQEVQLWEFLKSQNGLETVIKEKGANFSGGQCQRFSIARALLHDTPIYLFDEATSNIDVESEELIMQVIRGLAGRKTVILVSHRLANVTKADRIFLLKEGKIKEAGTHEQLLKSNGDYCQMYNWQKALEAYSVRTEV